MSFPHSISLSKICLSLFSLALLSLSPAGHAQLSTQANSSGQGLASASESSSQTLLAATDAEPGGGLAAAASATGGAAGGKSSWRHPSASNLAFELGAGFDAPVGNDNPYITWGGGFTLGAGLHFTKRFSGLVEYQFIDNKLPGAFIAQQGGQTGNAHIHSITFSPLVDLFHRRANSIYLVGNGGWYHKSTNFNTVYGYDYFGYPIFVTVASFSSNQWGGGGGIGISHRLGGTYGDGRLKLFAESRYLFLNTPGIHQTNGLGTTGLIPVSVGIRW